MASDLTAVGANIDGAEGFCWMLRRSCDNCCTLLRPNELRLARRPASGLMPRESAEEPPLQAAMPPPVPTETPAPPPPPPRSRLLLRNRSATSAAGPCSATRLIWLLAPAGCSASGAGEGRSDRAEGGAHEWPGAGATIAAPDPARPAAALGEAMGGGSLWLRSGDAAGSRSRPKRRGGAGGASAAAAAPAAATGRRNEGTASLSRARRKR